MRLFVAIFFVAAATNAGVLKHRIASDLPSRDEIAAALAQMKDMKLSELANVLKNSEAVRSSYRRAAMDMQEHNGPVKMMKRLASNPKIGQALRNFVEEGDNLFVRDLTNLRQKASPNLQSSVRAALDSMMADEGSRPLATHLKQAWDADSVDEQLKHLSMALDALDSSDSVKQAEAEKGDDDAGEAASDDSESAEDARADGDIDAEVDDEEEIDDDAAEDEADDAAEDEADDDDDEDDDDDDDDEGDEGDDESFEFEDEEEEEDE